jgi:outer membrane protein assembly factor BamE (lipoprotein component of BamABCDE complex)
MAYFMQKNQHTKYLFRSLVQLGAALMMLSAGACGPKVDSKGYVQNQDWKSLQVGKSTRDDVMNTFGSPSSRSSFGEETWYYVSARKETTAFFKPKTVERDTVRVVFDSAGVLGDIRVFDKESGKDVTLVGRETPTEGHTMGFFEQILSNIGRFNSAGGAGSAAPGRQQRPGL